MNIVNKLTLSHLKKNKGRTVITILGICVSVAMITAVFVSVASFMNLFGELTFMESGHKHADFYFLSEKQIDKLKKDDKIKTVGCYYEIPPEKSGFQIIGKTSVHNGTGNICAGDEKYLQQMITCRLDGKIPQNENEILVEESIITKNKLNWKIGDIVQLQLGGRYYYELGEKVYFSGERYYRNENFEPHNIKQFKITGILHGNSPTSYNGKIIRGLSNYEKRGKLSAIIELSKVNPTALKQIKQIALDIDASDYAINSDYLDTKFAINKDSVLAKNVIPMAAVLLIIIIAASVLLIYNAFGMSLSERTRYLGMLASVGATKKQKRQSVYFEGAILGAISIPIGVLAGIVGIAVTLKTVGDKIISTGMIMGIEDANINMKPVVPVWAIIAIIFFSFLTIYISSFIPSKKASAITPIEAIRQSKEIKIKSKKLKTPRYIQGIFGYEGELAYKSLKRNGKKSKIITISIAVSIVLFLSTNYFCSIFTQFNDMENQIPYQITVIAEYKDKNKIEKNLAEVSDIDDIYSVTNEIYMYGEKSKQDEQIYNKNITKKENLTASYKKLWNSKVMLFINAIDNEDFNKLCEENGIDYKQYYGKKKKIVIMNNISHKNGGSKVFTNNIIGKQIFHTQNTEKYTISDFVNYDESNYICNLNPKNRISAYIPESMYFNAEDFQNSFSLGIKTDKHTQVREKVLEILESNDYSSAAAIDYVEQSESMNTLVFVLQVFTYGFIILITLITIANIINTISTGIDLRRKEFAMLKSVGMTQKGFHKMICLESLFYGLKSTIFAIPLSILLSYLMYALLGEDTISFAISLPTYLSVIAAVFIIIGISMLYSLSKLKNDSIIETLKEDII